jgi:hypothetical protein
MAKPLVDNVPVKLGQLIPVCNIEQAESPKKLSTESDRYIALHIEDYTGDNERCVLFTLIEHSDMEAVVLPEDILKSMVKGRLYPCTLGHRDTNLVSVTHWDGRARVLRISATQLAKAERRASKHPETCPKKSFLTDLMD